MTPPTINVCGPSRGRWSAPIPAPEVFNPRHLRRKWTCEHPEHQGPRKKIRSARMFVQRWTLSGKEYREAIRDFDLFSLTVPPRWLCPKCARKERRKLPRRRTR